MPSDRQGYSRRTVLKAGGTVAIAGLLSSGPVIAQTDLPLEIEQFPEPEYFVIRNVGDEEVDITGYHINIEAEEGSETDQIQQLDGEVVIGPGEEVTVATGETTTIDADVQFVEPYPDERLANDGSDVVALLDENENFVAATDDTHQYDGDGDGDDDDGTDDEEDGTDDDGEDDEEMEEDDDEEDDAAAADDDGDEEEQKDEKEDKKDEEDEKEEKDDDCP